MGLKGKIKKKTEVKTEFLNKARENSRVAQICFDNGFYNACANRAYYVAFHAEHLRIKEERVTKMLISGFKPHLVVS